MKRTQATSSLEPNPCASGSAELPMFNLASTEVLAGLSAERVSTIVAPSNTGKTQLLEEVAEKIYTVWNMPVLLVYAKRQSKTPDMINFTIRGIEHFKKSVSDKGYEGVLLVDDLDHFSVMGENRPLNEARRRISASLMPLIVGQEPNILFCGTTLDHEPTIGDANEPTVGIAYDIERPSGRRRYDFDGAITEPVALSMLEEHFDPDQAREILNNFSAESLFYGAFRRVIEERSTKTEAAVQRHSTGDPDTEFRFREHAKVRKDLGRRGA